MLTTKRSGKHRRPQGWKPPKSSASGRVRLPERTPGSLPAACFFRARLSFHRAADYHVGDAGLHVWLRLARATARARMGSTPVPASPDGGQEAAVWFVGSRSPVKAGSRAGSSNKASVISGLGRTDGRWRLQGRTQRRPSKRPPDQQRARALETFISRATAQRAAGNVVDIAIDGKSAVIDGGLFLAGVTGYAYVADTAHLRVRSPEPGRRVRYAEGANDDHGRREKGCRRRRGHQRSRDTPWTPLFHGPPIDKRALKVRLWMFTALGDRRYQRMTLPLLRPGQTHQSVPKLKHAVVREMQALGHQGLANVINSRRAPTGREPCSP